MTDRKLLIEQLERLAIVLDEIMPLTAVIVRYAIVVLKKQEPVKPVIDSFLHKRCPSCGALLNGKFCNECGQEVKW